MTVINAGMLRISHGSHYLGYTVYTQLSVAWIIRTTNARKFVQINRACKLNWQFNVGRQWTMVRIIREFQISEGQIIRAVLY